MLITPTSNRSCKAQAIAETAAGLIVLIPVFLVLLDLAVLYMGYNQNVSAARDAARAASSCLPEASLSDGSTVVPPGSPLYVRAKSIIDSRKSTGGYVVGPDFQLKNTGTQPVRLTDFARPNAVYGGQFKGTVHVATHVRVNLPVAIPACTPGFVDLDSEASMPLTSVAESTITAPAP